MEEKVMSHNKKKVMTWEMKGSKCQEKIVTSFMDDPSEANDAKLQNDKVPQKNSLGWVKVQSRVYQKDCFDVNVLMFLLCMLDFDFLKSQIMNSSLKLKNESMLWLWKNVPRHCFMQQKEVCKKASRLINYFHTT